MATIVPFRGMRYSREKIADLAEVIIPPYDVITAEEQEQFYRRSPYNFIRLEYGKSGSEGSSGNRYTRAAAYLQKWRQEKILLVEEKPSLYLYRQTFIFEGNTYRRSGLISALKLEPYSKKVILPHEDTLPTPKADRLELMRHCQANFSPIFGLFSDPEEKFAEICGSLQQNKPVYDFADNYGERHTVWPVSGADPLQELIRLLAPRQIFIADGHHRYDTALRFSGDPAAENSPGRGYVLAVLVPLEDPGLLILPFHRLLKGLTDGQLELLQRNVVKHFEVTAVNRETGLPPRNDGGASETPELLLLLPDQNLLLRAKNREQSGELDVAMLRRLLFDPLFDSDALEKHLDYVIGEGEARQAVQSGKAQAAFLLHPTPLEAVTGRALKGENMPQKSTCFHPKLPAGLLINHLVESH